MASQTPDLGFDQDVLREKYRLERDKRLRAEGSDQYQEVSGDFSHYVDDPYVQTPISRAPLTDTMDVVVIGGGFGGLIAAARLRKLASKKSVLSKKAATLVALGTGTVIQAPPAILSPTSTCLCVKNSTMCQRRNIPMLRKSSSTAAK